MVSAGRLDEPIDLARPIRARNSLGEMAVTGWLTYAQVWAEVFQIQAREIVAAKRDADERSLAFRVRDGVAVEIGDRVEWRGALYGVTGIQPETRRGELVLSARALSGSDGR